MSGKICFVIMPFSDQENPDNNKWDDLFENNIRPAVEEAELDYTCYRSINTHGSFMYDIVNRLASAEVVIAVLTELRPNVMYELGIRHVLRRKTIMLVEKGYDIPGDLSAFIALNYSTRTTKDRKDLTETIRKRLQLLDEREPESDNPVSDHLWSRAVAICKEWYEKENPTVSLPRLKEVVPSYVFELEPVLLGARQHLNDLEKRTSQPSRRSRKRQKVTKSPLHKNLDEAVRQASILYTNRGLELKEAHDYEGALRCFDDALGLEPKNVTAWSNRALVLVQLQRYGEAAESARKVVGLQPVSATSWIALGKALFLLGRFNESANACKRAFELDQMSAVYANNAGVALEFNGQLEESLKYYEQALRLNPKFEHALYNRGIVLESLGRKTEASLSIKQALDINPSIAKEVESQRNAVKEKGSITPFSDPI